MIAAPPTSARVARRTVWLPGIVLAAEIVLFGLAATTDDLVVTPLSAAVAGGILVSGWLPVLLHPALETALAAAFVTVLAGVLIGPPPDVAAVTDLVRRAPLTNWPALYVVRLINGVLLLPLGVHLAARFPRRGPLSTRVIGSVYLIAGGMLLLLILALKPGQSLPWFIFTAWQIGLLALALWQLIRTGRTLDQPRSAAQARIMLFVVLVSQAPLLLRVLALPLALEVVSYDVILLAEMALPVGIAYAILRHDLFDIDTAVRRALAYGVLSISVLAVYLGFTVSLTAVLTQFVPQYRGLATIIGLLAAAAAFEPLRRRSSRTIDRWLYPEKLAFQAALSAARTQLDRVIARTELIELLTQQLPTTLGAHWASLSLAPAPDVPAQSDPAWNGELLVGGRSLGRYWLGPRRSGLPYEADEQAQLRALAQEAALVLAYSETFEQLNALNRELEERVTLRTAQMLEQQRALAALAERQRLARDLHDSVTQTLFSINLNARAIRGLLRRDPEAATLELSHLESDAQQALTEMRALLSQLRSPIAPQRDLVQLLSAQSVHAQQQHGLTVDLGVPDAVWVPETLAHELTQIVKEALHNVVKHSGVRAAQCRLLQDGDVIELTVQDHGDGFTPNPIGDAAPGGDHFGVRGMRERVTALGGTLDLQSAPGAGTRLRVRVPYEKNQ